MCLIVVRQLVLNRTSSNAMNLIQAIVLSVLTFFNVSKHVVAVPDVHRLNIHQHHLKHKPHFIEDEDFLVNPGQVFGTCYEMILNPKTIKVKCTFIMETTEAFDSPDHLRVCNFTLKSVTQHDKKNYYTPLKLTAIDKNKAFLVMTHIDHRRFYILHFANCRAVEVKLGFNNPIVAAPYHNRFDVIITKDEKGFCDSKYCKLVFNTEGKIIVDKHDWLHEDTTIVAITHSPLQRSIVIDKSQKQWRNSGDGLVRIYSVNDDGSINIIWQCQAQAGPGVHYGAISTSTTNQLITVCSTNKVNMTCAQFDWNGVLKFERLFESENYNLIHTQRVYSMPGGGFVLVTTRCYKENNVKQCKKNGDNIFIKKVNKDGEIVGSMDITSWKHIEVKKLHFYVSNDQKMCLSYAYGHDVKYDGTISLYAICFDDSDFTKEFF